MSNFTCWPRAGGLEDQDPLFINDALTYLALENMAREEMGMTPSTEGIAPESFD